MAARPIGFAAALFAGIVASAHAIPGDWPEPRQNPRLTAVQSLPGLMRSAPETLARFDLGRSQPAITAVNHPTDGPLALGLGGGALACYDPAGPLRWRSHPDGLNFQSIAAADDLDGDGRIEILLMAGRPTSPYAAAIILALDDGRLRWQYDVEPMSYAWYLYAGTYFPESAARQIVVLMQGYPPDEKNGYITLFTCPEPGAKPQPVWRYDFDQYTCFPTFMQNDLDADGIPELVVETHSRMWFLDARTGSLKHFAKWDVSPANVRSYGFNRFVDLDRDGRDDFLCIADFAQHHEVLLNRNGHMEEAWHYGWPESVTTGKVATTWPEPPYADIDGDRALEVAVSMFNDSDSPDWAVRVYDAVTGTLEVRAPGFVAVSVDKCGHILANRCSDPTRSHTEGAALLEIGAGGVRALWEDKTATAVSPREGAQALISRNGSLFSLETGADGLVAEIPWSPAQIAAPDWSKIPATEGPPFPALLAADCLGEGRCQVALYQEPRVRILRMAGNTLDPAGEYTSAATPAFADLDGDIAADLIRCEVSDGAPPVVEAISLRRQNTPIWRSEMPQSARPGLPQPRRAYLRTGRFTGKPTPDIYLWSGAPIVRSVVLDGATGALVWERGETPGLERYWGPSANYAAAYDADGDGAEDLVFTNPDYYCIAAGPTGDALFGPAFPPDIFHQPSQGLYTCPVLLPRENGAPTVCLVSGHYFQGVMSLHAEPRWYQLPAVGDHATGREGFLQLPDGKWLMGFDRQNGRFACIDVDSGTVRWEYELAASASDVISLDVDHDGAQEFVFGTSHGLLIALGDGGGNPREVWRCDLGAGIGAPVAADVNGDGASEVIVSTADGQVLVLGPAPIPANP